MGNSLSCGVIKMLHVGARDHVPGVAHSWGFDGNLKVQVVGRQICVLKIWQELRILSWEGAFERSKGLWSDHPW